MKTFRSLTTALLSTALLAVTALAGDPTGNWTFKAEGPNGRALESKLTLDFRNNELTGTIENRAGKANISDASFVDEQVSFTVTREFRGRTFSTRYSGKLEGETINGTLKSSGRGDKDISITWQAKRTK